MRRGAWLAGVAVVALCCARRSHRGEPCPLAQGWTAPRPHHDYFQSVSFRPDGTGEMAMGEGQHVRAELAFRWTHTRGAVTFRYARGDLRRVAVTIESGDFVVVDPGYDDPHELHYRCRARFGASPFPPDADVDAQRTFYGCLTR